MAKAIFISYRRSDSQHAAFALADRLRWAFGEEQVFFDRGIRTGNAWPDELKAGLEAAEVVIVVMGRTWLTSADQWGRRRIDDPNDWVRREICTAIASTKKLFPILLDETPRVRAEALD